MPEDFGVSEALARSTSRRGLLARAGRALVAVAGGSLVAAAVKPDDGDAFHFCGHIYTTDSCPHPTGLPRIDAHGLPLRARDGRPVDNLGRLVDAAGRPVAEDGRPLLDLDGRPLPPAPRTNLCLDSVRERFGMKTWIDRSWHRCCGGRVRKLIDCCSYNPRRINGDAALRGYCDAGRHVFCVMYYDTNVSC